MNCSQCGKPAVTQVQNSPLCVDCLLKLEQAMNLQQARLASMMNFLLGEAEDAVGMRGLFQRYHVPQPTIQTGPSTFNNIRVDRSVVGAINTGSIQKLDIAMSHVRAGGELEFAEALKKLTQAVVDAGELNVEAKNEILEHLSFLASQAVIPKEQRQRSIARTVIQTLERILAAAGALGSLWGPLKPFAEALFS